MKSKPLDPLGPIRFESQFWMGYFLDLLVRVALEDREGRAFDQRNNQTCAATPAQWSYSAQVPRGATDKWTDSVKVEILS